MIIEVVMVMNSGQYALCKPVVHVENQPAWCIIAAYNACMHTDLQFRPVARGGSGGSVEPPISGGRK